MNLRRYQQKDNEMKTKLSIVHVMVLILSLVAAAPVSAKAPLVGAMDLQFNLGWPGPQAHTPDWVGTITIDDEEYGMAFFAIGSGKPFNEDPSASVHFFEEIWKIYDELEFEFNEFGVLTEFEEGDVLLWGYDTGITNLKNSKYHMNGSVEADDLFDEWVGRNVHMSGDIEWYDSGAPQSAPGTFRIN